MLQAPACDWTPETILRTEAYAYNSHYREKFLFPTGRLFHTHGMYIVQERLQRVFILTYRLWSTATSISTHRYAARARYRKCRKIVPTRCIAFSPLSVTLPRETPTCVQCSKLVIPLRSITWAPSEYLTGGSQPTFCYEHFKKEPPPVWKVAILWHLARVSSGCHGGIFTVSTGIDQGGDIENPLRLLLISTTLAQGNRGTSTTPDMTKLSPQKLRELHVVHAVVMRGLLVMVELRRLWLHWGRHALFICAVHVSGGAAVGVGIVAMHPHANDLSIGDRQLRL